LYSIGFLVSYLIVLLLVAEPIHHLGKFSLGDVICARFPSTKMRWMMAVSSFIISILYLIPQLVAAGLLIRLLLDINYTASVLVIGSLMTIYVAFGGMLATSWVQIIKTIVLLGGVFLLSLIVFSRIQWNISDLIQRVEEGTVWGEKYFLAGQLFDSPIEIISLSLALILGTAGLPHILIRMYTVRDTTEVRRSILTATWIIGSFYFMTLIIGFGAVAGDYSPSQALAFPPSLAIAVMEDFYIGSERCHALFLSAYTYSMVCLLFVYEQLFLRNLSG